MKNYSEQDVQNIMESVCPDLKLRSIYMDIISAGIVEANRYDRGAWSINFDKHGVRLTVAHYYICVIDGHGIWLALDNIFLHGDENQRNYLPTMKQLYTWGWSMDTASTPGSYPVYRDKSMRTEFSANGYYKIGNNHQEAWKHIRKLFLNFIYNAIYHGQKMDQDSPGKHCSGFLKYVRNKYDITLPDPLYEL